MSVLSLNHAESTFSSMNVVDVIFCLLSYWKVVHSLCQGLDLAILVIDGCVEAILQKDPSSWINLMCTFQFELVSVTVAVHVPVHEETRTWRVG